jgi:photosynthetic reaction center cytochrome c subunit
MNLQSSRAILAITAGLCVLSAGTIHGQNTTPPNAQTNAAAAQRPQMAEEVFKSVQLLKGVPVDEFMDTMGFFSASTNLNCIDCHGAAAGGGWEHYADETAMKAKARKMMLMVQALNRDNFGGTPFVTCYTCHHGDMRPADTPSLAVQYSSPTIDPNEMEVTRQAAGAPSADEIFAKCIQALGGAQRLAGVTSFIAKGTYNGYDTEFEDVPIEIYAKAPDQRSTVIHFRSGDSVTSFDGRDGWIYEADKPVPLIQLTGGELDGARVDVSIAFPARLKQVRATWQVGNTSIDDRRVFIVEGTGGSPQPVKLYFDRDSGLLVRQVRYVQLRIGRVPAQFDYDDYREVAGVKIPFKVVATWVDGRSTTKLMEVQANVPIDGSRFAKPSTR